MGTKKPKGKTHRYACFTAEQQAIFDSLTIKQKRYVVLRGQGYKKSDAYVQAGYKNSYPAQSASTMERRDTGLVDLIDTLLGTYRTKEVYKPESKVNEEIDKKAEELPVEMESVLNQQKLPALEQTNEMNVETAKKISFYRGIMDGTVKSTKTMKTFDKDGHLTGTKIEYTSTIADKIQARRELDRILGVSDMLQLGEVQAGNINIMIVDTSKNDKKELDKDKELDGTIEEKGGSDEK